MVDKHSMDIQPGPSIPMVSSPQTVLITGAAGFLGSFLVDLYADSGSCVHATYRQTEPSFISNQNIQLHRLELRDPVATRKVVMLAQPKIVMHLAAQSSVAQSWADPAGTYENNMIPQVHLLEACLAIDPPPRVLVMGSADEYGSPAENDNPVTEDQPLKPINPYGVSKVGQDLMGYQYFHAYDLPVMRVRPFLQVGPRRSESFMAGTFAKQVAEVELGLKPPVIEVGDIDAVRDMTDVRDVARACKAVTESGRAGQVYNIASGRPRSIRSLLLEMISSAGINPEIRTAPSRVRSREPALLVGNLSRLQADTGWHPEIPFEESARDSVEFWKDRVSVTIAAREGEH